MVILLGLLVILTLAIAIIASVIVISITVTSDDRNRLILLNGEPLRLANKPYDLIIPGFMDYYDYTKSLIELEYELAEFFTKNDKGDETVDEMAIGIKLSIYCSLADIVDEDNSDDIITHRNKLFNLSLPWKPGSLYKKRFELIKKMWQRGIRPNSKCMLTDSKPIKDLVDSFVLATLGGVVGEHTWKDIVYKRKEFQIKLTKALKATPEDNDLLENSFQYVGLDNSISCAIKQVVLPETFKESLYQLAKENQLGEAAVARSTHAAAAEQKEYEVIEKHLKAAAIKTMRISDNKFFLSFDPGDIFKALTTGNLK